MLEAVVGVWVGKNGHGVPLMGVDDDASRLARKCARPARPLSRLLAPVRLARQGSRQSLPRGSSTASIPEFRKEVVVNMTMTRGWIMSGTCGYVWMLFQMLCSELCACAVIPAAITFECK